MKSRRGRPSTNRGLWWEGAFPDEESSQRGRLEGVSAVKWPREGPWGRKTPREKLRSGQREDEALCYGGSPGR